MRSNERHPADWKDGDAYAPLLQADRSIFAWEWLRRDPAYRAAAERALELRSCRTAGGDRMGPDLWGLHAFEPPHLAAPWARPLWRAEIHPYVLKVRAEAPGASSDLFDLVRFRGHTRIVTGPDAREHLLISDGLRTIPIDVLEGSLMEAPVYLHYLVAGLASAERPLLTLRRLVGFSPTGEFSRSLHPCEARARRWLLILRTHDAITAGAGQREIAAELLSSAAGEPRWRSREPSVRSQVQRLVRAVKAMKGGGYRSLLE